MSQLRIHVEQFPNKGIRDFHLSQTTYSKPWSSYDDKGVPKKIQALTRKFTMLPQVQDDPITDMVKLKLVRVTLNPVFTWEECIEAVVGLLKRYFKTDDVLITVMERDPVWDIPQTEREEMY